MRISIIIPTFNEEEHIGKLLDFVSLHAAPGEIEILVADAQSTDATRQIAASKGARVVLVNKPNRAMQMNAAAAIATGDVLYFVHADTLPPTTFVNDIRLAISQNYHAGRYQTKFSENNLLLRFNAFFTRYDLFVCYGGDQTLFITRAFFREIGGFDESKKIMEDYDITQRIKSNQGRYKIFKKPAVISARKYRNNSWLKVQKANYKAVKMYKRGICTSFIAEQYRQMLRF